MDIGTRSDLTEDDSFYDFKKTSSPGDPPVWTFISDAGEKKEADQAGQGGWSAKINVKTQCEYVCDAHRATCSERRYR